MVNWSTKLETKEIPTKVNYLINLLGDCYNNLSYDHFLTPFFDQYSNWMSSYKQTPIPEKVIQLATYAHSLYLFKQDFTNPKILKHLIKKLCDKNHIAGLLLEFRSCIHFDGLHKIVKWLPNTGNVSESDIKLVNNQNQIIYVECTSRTPKDSRRIHDNILIRDILNSLRDKRNQSSYQNKPRIIAIFIPEDIDLTRDKFRETLGMKIKERFMKEDYNQVSAVIIIANTPISINNSNSGFYYDTDLTSLTYPNFKAEYELPKNSINKNGI